MAAHQPKRPLHTNSVAQRVNNSGYASHPQLICDVDVHWECMVSHQGRFIFFSILLCHVIHVIDLFIRARCVWAWHFSKANYGLIHLHASNQRSHRFARRIYFSSAFVCHPLSYTWHALISSAQTKHTSASIGCGYETHGHMAASMRTRTGFTFVDTFLYPAFLSLSLCVCVSLINYGSTTSWPIAYGGHPATILTCWLVALWTHDGLFICACGRTQKERKNEQQRMDN